MCFAIENLAEFNKGPEYRQVFMDYFKKDLTAPPFDAGIDPQLKQY